MKKAIFYFLCLIPFISLSQSTPVYSTKFEVYVYQHSDVNSAVVAKIEKGEKVKVLNSFSSDMWQIRYGEISGWVKKSLLIYYERDKNKDIKDNSNIEPPRNIFEKHAVYNNDIQLAPSPIIGYNTGIGDSKYDEGLLYDNYEYSDGSLSTDEYLNERRADKQSQEAKALKSLLIIILILSGVAIIIFIIFFNAKNKKST